MELPLDIQQHLETVTRDIGGLEALKTVLTEEDIVFLGAYPTPIFVISSYDYYNWINRDINDVYTEPPLDLSKVGYVYGSPFYILNKDYKTIYISSLSEGEYFGSKDDDNIIYKIAASSNSGCSYFFILLYTNNEYKVFPILIFTKPTELFYNNFLSQYRKLYNNISREYIHIPHNFILYTDNIFKYKSIADSTSFLDRYKQQESITVKQNTYILNVIERSVDNYIRVQLHNKIKVWIPESSIEVLYINIYILQLEWRHTPSIEEVKSHKDTQIIRYNPSYFISLNLSSNEYWIVINQEYNLLSIINIIGSSYYSIIEVTKGLYFIKPLSGKSVNRYNLLQRNLNKSIIEPIGVKRIHSSGNLEYTDSRTLKGSNILGSSSISSSGLSLQDISNYTYSLRSSHSKLVTRIYNIQTTPIKELDIYGSFTIGHDRNYFLTDSNLLNISILIYKDNNLLNTVYNNYSIWYGLSLYSYNQNKSIELISEGLLPNAQLYDKYTIYKVDDIDLLPDKIEVFIYDQSQLYILRYFDLIGIPTFFDSIPTDSQSVSIRLFSDTDIIYTIYNINYKKWDKIYYLQTYDRTIELRSVGEDNLNSNTLDILIYTFNNINELPKSIEVVVLDESTDKSTTSYLTSNSIQFYNYIQNRLDIGILIYKDYSFCDTFYEQFTAYNGIYYKQISNNSWELRLVGKSISSTTGKEVFNDCYINTYYGSKYNLPHKIQVYINKNNPYSTNDNINNIYTDTVSNHIIYTYSINNMTILKGEELNNNSNSTPLSVYVYTNSYTYLVYNVLCLNYIDVYYKQVIDIEKNLEKWELYIRYTEISNITNEITETIKLINSYSGNISEIPSEIKVVNEQTTDVYTYTIDNLTYKID